MMRDRVRSRSRSEDGTGLGRIEGRCLGHRRGNMWIGRRRIVGCMGIVEERSPSGYTSEHGRDK